MPLLKRKRGDFPVPLLPPALRDTVAALTGSRDPKFLESPATVTRRPQTRQCRTPNTARLDSL